MSKKRKCAFSRITGFFYRRHRTISVSKRHSWKTYVSRLTIQTPEENRCISGKPASLTKSHLKANGVNVEQAIERN